MAFKMKMKGFYKNFDFGSKKPENKRNYNKEMDLNADKYGPSAGETVAGNKFQFEALEEKDFSPHNISARRTEGTIEQQRKLREQRGLNKKKKC